MKDYKKTLWGSALAFLLGSSCCWLSALSIWLGGAALIGSLATTIGYLQPALISIGCILLVYTLFKYHTNNTR